MGRTRMVRHSFDSMSERDAFVLGPGRRKGWSDITF